MSRQLVLVNALVRKRPVILPRGLHAGRIL